MIKTIRSFTLVFLFTYLIPFIVLGQFPGGGGNFSPQGFQDRFQNFENKKYLDGLDLKSKVYNKNLGWYVPKNLKPDQKDETMLLLKRLKKVCPNCSQAPVVSTDIPVILFNDQPTYQPVCPTGKKFDSISGICINHKNTCDVPGWMMDKIPFLEKAIKISDVQKKFFHKDPCKKDYLVFLIDISIKHMEQKNVKK